MALQHTLTEADNEKDIDVFELLISVLEGLGYGALSLLLFAVPMAIAYLIFNSIVG